jgi:inorganic triphosphatase YgiF
MPREIELKLAVAARHLAALERSPLLARSRRTRKRLYAIYYDTPDGALQRQGIALRLRREGTRWVQAVKWGGGIRGGLHERGELEHPVSGPLADFEAITEPSLAAVFATPGLRAQLKPAFITEFERLSLLYSPAPDTVVEICFDRGAVKGGDHVEPLSELELELKSGPPWRVYAAALVLMAGTPFRLELRSKAFRGYALLGAVTEAPAKAATADLQQDLSVQAAFRAIAFACLSQLQANQHGMLADADHEYLHQMRVAIRRLRSAFSLFKAVLPPAQTDPHLVQLRRAAATLGAARDWDVFETERLPGVAAQFRNHRAMTALTKAVAETRRSRGAAARRAIAGVRWQRYQLELAAWLAAGEWEATAAPETRAALAAPVLPFARAVLEARFARTRKRAKQLAQLSDPELHQLRIAVKKVRYAAEFFAPLFDDARGKAFRAAAGRLQDALGIVNDAAVVMPLLTAAGLGRGALREAGALVTGWSGHEAHREKQNLQALWRVYVRTGGYWSGKP